MSELKGFKFGFDISKNNNASGRLCDKNDDAFTFEFGVDDATLLMDSPQTTSSVKQQHRISKKSKKKKKKTKKGEKSTSTINNIQDGGEHETWSAVDVTVSVATKNHEEITVLRMCHIHCQVPKWLLILQQPVLQRPAKMMRNHQAFNIIQS